MGSPKLETNKSFKLQHASPDSAKTPEGAPPLRRKEQISNGAGKNGARKSKKRRRGRFFTGYAAGRLPTCSALLYSTLLYSAIYSLYCLCLTGSTAAVVVVPPPQRSQSWPITRVCMYDLSSNRDLVLHCLSRKQMPPPPPQSRLRPLQTAHHTAADSLHSSRAGPSEPMRALPKETHPVPNPKTAEAQQERIRHAQLFASNLASPECIPHFWLSLYY